MLVRRPFGSAVKRDDRYIISGSQSGDQTFRILDVQKIVRGRIGGKGDHGNLAPLDVEVSDVADLARVRNTKRVQCPHGAFASFGAEVVSVVIRQTHDIESGLLQMLAVARRNPEGEAAR